MRVGETWNESILFTDPITGRSCRQLSTYGLFNETPTYHIHNCFSADNSYLIFGTARDEGAALIRADVATGDLTCVATWEGFQSNGRTGRSGDGPNFHEISMIQATNQAVARIGDTLRLYDLLTFEETILMDQVGEDHHLSAPSASRDGSYIVAPKMPKHPDRHKLPHQQRSYIDACYQELGGQAVTYLKVDVATKEVSVFYQEESAGANHLQPSPTDPDLWLMDRDWAPGFSWYGDHGKTTRMWLLRESTGEMTPLNPRDENKFQMHTNWSHDGQHVYYHGRCKDRAWTYLGAIDLNGEVVFEHKIPKAGYGHVCSDTTQRAIIQDGHYTDNLITRIFYEDLSPAGVPRMEILAQHDTDWGSPAGQYSHPHVHMSPDGKWMAYNRTRSGASDVVLFEI